MKRKLFAGLAFLALLLTVNSCTNYDDYLSEYEVRKMIEQALKEHGKTQWEIVVFDIRKNDWEWNDAERRWQVFADLPELTEFIYEEGAALGHVFLGLQGKDEVQTALPYSYTYKDTNTNEVFTETISCDFQLSNPSTVGFYLQQSDLNKDLNSPDNYSFRVVLIW